MAARKARPTALRFQSLVIRLKRAQRYCGWGTSFDPVDAGGIEESWRQQPGTPCYTKDLNSVQLKVALAAAERSRVPEYRKAADDAAKAFFQPEPNL